MGSVFLDVQNLSGKGFRNVSFQVKRGEILGIAGLMGAGRTELMEAVFGVTRSHGGTIQYQWEGRQNQFAGRRHSRWHGLADRRPKTNRLVPECQRSREYVHREHQ